MRYRKKQVVIDALQWTGQNHRDMWEFLGGSPDKFIEPSGEHFYIDHTMVTGGLVIKTLEGEHVASVDDYIIKGIQGEYYPCKPSVFAATYVSAEVVGELLPCPFCGSSGRLIGADHAHAGIGMVACFHCGCRMYGGVAEWNSRGHFTEKSQEVPNVGGPL